MNVTKAYYYLFYKLYKFWESISTPKFWSDWKAGISIIALELWLLLSFEIYFEILTKTNVELGIKKPSVLIPFGAVLLLNYLAFVRTDKWKRYVHQFEKLPKYKNKIGGIIVWSIIFLIVANLIFSFYLMSRINWGQSK